MGETTDQIESYIESRRGDLGSNLQELEQKVKSATDWRQQFQKNPMTMVAVAFGGGVLLASMVGGGRRHRYRGVPSETHTPHAGTDQMAHKALETWDNIKGALIGVAATRFKDFVGEVVPGFQEQFRKTEDAKRMSSPGDVRAAAVRSAS
jgi:hypothetical protein